MNRVLPIFLVAATACTGNAYWECSDNVFTYVAYEQASAVDCSKSTYPTDLAAKLLTDSKYWPNPKPNTSLLVHTRAEFIDSTGRCDLGVTYFAGDVEVGSQEYPILHELLHVDAMQHLDYSTSDHHGWDTDGRYALDNLYAFKLLNSSWFVREPGDYSIYMPLHGGSCDYDPPLTPAVETNLRLAGWGGTIDSRHDAVNDFCHHEVPHTK
jgi:hypothetical protein